MSEKKSWQDYAYFAGTILASLSLIPAILNPNTLFPLAASVPTVIAMMIFTIAHFSLGFKFAGTFSVILTLLWAYIALFRHG